MVCTQIRQDPPPVSNYDKWADSRQTVLMTCINATYKTVVKKTGGKRPFGRFRNTWEIIRPIIIDLKE
jgi:hypothetical protein